MQIDVSDWQTAGAWSRYGEGTQYRHITYDCVICSQYVRSDGVKQYEFFSKQTKYKISDFSSPQMQAVDKILYFIKNEDKFKTVGEKETEESK